ncbi:hypothetical protein OTU49_010027, partial [Cherax quadricarinatus]
LVPEIMSSGDLIHKVASSLVHSGCLKGDKEDLGNNPQSLQHWSCRGLPSLPVAPLHRLFTVRNITPPECHGSAQGPAASQVSHSLSRLIYAFTTHLMSTNSKFLMLGCVETLSQLSEKYPPALYPSAWGCHITPVQSSENKMHTGLITHVLSLAGESPFAGDLNVQQNILTIASNILAGIAIEVLRQGREDVVGAKAPWAFLGASQVTAVAECVVQHILRILCVYTHVLEDILPGSRPTLAPLTPQSTLSPIK